MLCLDYSDLQERRNISKLYMIDREHYFLYMVLEINVLNGIFYKRKIFQPKYQWVSIWVLCKADVGNFFAYVIMLFLNIRRHLPRQLLRVNASWKGCIWNSILCNAERNIVELLLYEAEKVIAKIQVEIQAEVNEKNPGKF